MQNENNTTELQEQNTEEIKSEEKKETKKPHPIFRESTSDRYRSYTTTPYFQNLEYNHLTKDLRDKYDTKIHYKGEKKEVEIGISEALNVLITMLVCAAALGFIGYGFKGIIGGGIGAVIGLFIGMMVDTILLIIYSNRLETKSQKQRQQSYQHVAQPLKLKKE